MGIFYFAEKYEFLSNYYERPITFMNIKYNSSEAAYQAQKCFNENDKYLFCGLTADEAKKMGRKVVCRPDWNDIKVSVMEKVVDAKFYQHPDLREKLIATGDEFLCEGNWWGDDFWGMKFSGVYSSSTALLHGENHLGKTLMKVRQKYMEEV